MYAYIQTQLTPILWSPRTEKACTVESPNRTCLTIPERFYRYNIVLGSQCISSGQHYWEVDRKEVVCWVIRLREGTGYR